MKKFLFTAFAVLFFYGILLAQDYDRNWETKYFQSLQDLNTNDLNQEIFYLNLIHQQAHLTPLKQHMIKDFNLKPFEIIFNSADRGDEYLLDSIYNYHWVTPGRSEWNLDIKHFYAYDLDGNITSLIIKTWDEETNTFINGTKFSYFYNDDGLLNETLWQFWAENEWMNFSRYTFTYDNEGRETESISQDWDFMSNEWVYTQKDTYTYGDNGLMSEWLQEYYTQGKRMWHNNSYRQFTYNSNDDLILELIQVWIDTKGAWENYEKIESTYQNDNLIEDLWQRWLTGSSDWVNYWRHLYEYDDNNSIIDHITQDWLVSDWENDYRWLWTYDSGGNPTEILEKNWEGTEWVNSVRTLDSYDENEYLIEDLIQEWDDIASAWENWFKINLFWSLHEVVGQNDVHQIDHSVSPNPFSGYANIAYTIDQCEYVEINIYNLSGQVIESLANAYKITGNHKIGWDASTHPPGLYFYKIQTSNGTSSGKLIVQD